MSLPASPSSFYPCFQSRRINALFPFVGLSVGPFAVSFQPTGTYGALRAASFSLILPIFSIFHIYPSYSFYLSYLSSLFFLFFIFILPILSPILSYSPFSFPISRVNPAILLPARSFPTSSCARRRLISPFGHPTTPSALPWTYTTST